MAAALAIFFTVKNSRTSSLKLIDLTGIATFGVMTVVAAIGNATTDANVVDFGRGAAALVLGAIMLDLGRVRAVHRAVRPGIRVARVLGLARLPRAKPSHQRHLGPRRSRNGGRALAGRATSTRSRRRRPTPVPIDFLFNWVIPVLLVLGAINLTKQVVAGAQSRAPTSQVPANR